MFLRCQPFYAAIALAGGAVFAAGLNPTTVPLIFSPNSGQEDAAVRFTSRGPGFSLAFTSQETILRATRAGHTGTLRLNVVHPRPDSTISGLDELPAKVNYIIGNDPAKWHIGIASYGRVVYKSVHPGVDLVYYGKGRTLEYDFHVAPGIDPRKIEMAIGGGDWKAQVTPAGDLAIHSQDGSIVFDKPVAYQVAADGSRQTVAARYWLKKGKRFGFRLGSYDPNRELVIDPSLAWATFYGGSNYEFGTAIALDTLGNVYVGGFTNSIDLPGTSGGYQPSPKPAKDNMQGGNGGYTGFLAKFNPAGTQLIYATYLGGSTSGGSGMAGSSVNDAILGIAVDAQGDAVVVGATDSTDFPLQNAVQTTCGPQNTINSFYCTVTLSSTCANGSTADAFVTKLNPTGSGLIYSTYLGGSGWDQANAVVLNSAGEAFVTGNTNSVIEHSFRGICGAGVVNNEIPFVTTANAYYATPAANSNPDPATAQTYAFLTKLSASGALEYSSYFGPQLSGTTSEGLQTLGNAIALDSANNVYLAGQTNDTNFPTTIPGTNIGQCNNCNVID